MTDHCCAHPKCPGGSLCCCQGQPDPIERAVFDSRFQHYDGYKSPARQDDLFRVFQSGMQYAYEAIDTDELASLLAEVDTPSDAFTQDDFHTIALAVKNWLTGGE